MNSLQSLIPLSSRETWDQINDQIKQKYFPSISGSVRCFSSLAESLIEIVQGTSQFLSHRKHISVFSGACPAFELLTPHFIREVLHVQHFTSESLPKTIEEAKAWVEALPKDTAYVLFAEDHVVTAEIYQWSFLDQALNDKRIFSLRVSHHTHKHASHVKNLLPFSVQICIYDIHHVVALCGSRFKTPSGSVSWMNWDASYISSFDQIPKTSENKSLVLSFEENFSEQRFFKDLSSRLYDRAVLCFPDVNSDRFIQRLRKSSPSISGTNLCSWSSFKLMNNWWKPEPSKEQLRGLLILGIESLEQKNLAASLKMSYEEIIREQTWEIP